MLAWACHLPEVGGDRHHATQGDVTCFTPVMLVAMKRLGKECLTVLLLTLSLLHIATNLTPEL